MTEERVEKERERVARKWYISIMYCLEGGN